MKAMNRYLAASFAVTLLLAGAALTSGSPVSRAATNPTRAQMVGQRMIVAFAGTTPDTGLLARIRAGQIGGVLLSSGNIRDAAQLTQLTGRLQAAARAGGQPPLLIATDQEGGLVRRIPWAPPKASAQELGTSAATHIEAVGRSAGLALRDAGVNLDLAPVADVPRSTSNFLEVEHRAFSTNRLSVANDSAAFAEGLEEGGVLPTLKHFPGLGRAGATSTDDAVVRILATRDQIATDLLPYRVALARSLNPVIMLSTAVYPAYSTSAAAWSGALARTLLRHDLGFRGVEITDSLTAAATVRGVTPGVLAIRSAGAGVDLLLVTGSEASSQATYEAVLGAARDGRISSVNLRASYARILQLKARI